jgi:hypothetical protein
LTKPIKARFLPLIRGRLYELTKTSFTQKFEYPQDTMNLPTLLPFNSYRKPIGTYFYCFAILFSVINDTSFAGSTLVYQFKESGKSFEQQLQIQDSWAWISGLGGNPQIDLLFDARSGEWAVIDREHQSFTHFSEKSIHQLSSQLELITPLVSRLGKQTGNLSTEQQDQWSQFLKKAPIEEINQLQKMARKAKLVAKRSSQREGGIECRLFEVDSSSNHHSFCLAEPSAFAIPERDSMTLAKMSESIRAIIQSAGLISTHFGFHLSAKDLTKIAGFPVSFREGESKSGLELQFLGAKNAAKPLHAPDIPSSFHKEKIKLW